VTEPTEKPTITTAPDRPGEALIHLPEFTYLDTQAWSADIGIPEAALRDLQDTITRHLHADREPGEQFHRARRDIEDIVDRMGGLDSWVIVRVLWSRFRGIPTDAEPDPTLDQVRDRLAAEYHRRRARYDSGEIHGYARHQVAGELIGLLGALGITLGGTVPAGDADIAGRAYYEQWLTRQETPDDQPAQNGERP
jgi:hypothetical protein